MLWVKGDLKNSEQPPTVPEMCGDTTAHPRIQCGSWEVRAEFSYRKTNKRNKTKERKMVTNTVIF